VPQELITRSARWRSYTRNSPYVYIVRAEFAQVVSRSRQKEKSKLQLGWNDSGDAEHNLALVLISTSQCEEQATCILDMRCYLAAGAGVNLSKSKKGKIIKDGDRQHAYYWFRRVYHTSRQGRRKIELR